MAEKMEAGSSLVGVLSVLSKQQSEKTFCY
jgi:hypothetical protein